MDTERHKEVTYLGRTRHIFLGTVLIPSGVVRVMTWPQRLVPMTLPDQPHLLAQSETQSGESALRRAQAGPASPEGRAESQTTRAVAKSRKRTMMKGKSRYIHKKDRV